LVYTIYIVQIAKEGKKLYNSSIILKKGMNINMANDEKETKLVELFNRKRSIEKTSKSVAKELQGFRVEKSRVCDSIHSINDAKRDAFLSFMGKGKYADIIMEPIRLRGELDSLESLANNPYSGETDPKAVKAYNGKAPVYKEDIEYAEEAAKKAEQEVSDILVEYFELPEEKRILNKAIKVQVKLLKYLSKELKSIDKQIKKTDKALTKDLANGRTK
jgi:hypothetical protein